MFTFKGGVHPHEMKELTKDKPIRVIKTSDEMVYPMAQHLGKPAEVSVQVGDDVLMGQIIGKASGPISANVVCACSGNV
ncbi:MAG: electron transporter RnfC, partial [Lachnospiraceae bacterium]|nr:electron transporter RnfC [Lachnospiraceae bacterium]